MKQELETVPRCPICGSSLVVDELDVKDFSLSGEVFAIQTCGNCLLQFTNPRPTENQIEKYYLSDNYISHTNESRSVFGKIYQRARKIAIRKKFALIQGLTANERPMLLDYGCGTGEFVAYSKTRAWSVSGIEVSALAREKAQHLHGIEPLLPEALKYIASASIDIVTLWHVLEHVYNLNDLMSEFQRVVKLNGHVIIAVPNPESFDAKYYGRFWAAWDVPIHLYHFKAKNIQDLAKKHGFEVVKIKTMPFDAFYISLLSEEYRSGKKRWLRAFVLGLVSNIKGMNQNTSSLTYVLRKCKT